MRLKIKVSKLANQFFFVSNLAEWHFSCRPEYNKEWLSKTGKLSSEEKKILTEFRKLMEKYGFIFLNGQDRYLGTIFYNYSGKTAWKELKKNVSNEEYELLKDIFSAFSRRFELTWRSIPQKEKDRRIKLLRNTLRLKKNKYIRSALGVLFKEIKPKKIRLIVLFSPLKIGETAAGSANIGNDSLTFEVPELKPNTLELDISIGILFHEIIHLLFKKIGALKMIEKIRKELKLPRKIIKNAPFSTTTLISEMAVNSLSPYGYLTRKFYGEKFTSEIFSSANVKLLKDSYKKSLVSKVPGLYSLTKYFAWKFYPVTANYLNSGRKIDENFLRTVALILKAKEPLRAPARGGNQFF